jgi:Na+/phosphate symporter
VGLADLAEETGSTPELILLWAKQAMEGIEQTFSKEMHQQRKVLHREILEKDDRIRKLESVVLELSTEILLFKKSTGDLSPGPTLRRRRRKRS